MSSHHVVKEDQEPALLILNPNSILFEKVQELLEWSPLVIVSATALEGVLRWGIKIDVLLTPDIGEEYDQVKIDQSPLDILHYKEAQSELAAGLQFLCGRKQFNVNVLVSEPSHYFSVAASYSDRISIVLLAGKFKWHFVGNGSYSKWLPSQTKLKLFSNNSLEAVVSTETGLYQHEQLLPFWVGEEF
jgi:thiamine pyrophosphokinase